MDYTKDEFVVKRIDEIEATVDRLANYLVFRGNEEGLTFDNFLDFEKNGHDDMLEDRQKVFFSAIARAIKLEKQLTKK